MSGRYCGTFLQSSAAVKFRDQGRYFAFGAITAFIEFLGRLPVAPEEAGKSDGMDNCRFVPSSSRAV